MILVAKMKEIPLPAVSTSSTPQEHIGCGNSRENAKNRKGSISTFRRFLCMFSLKHSKQQQPPEEAHASPRPSSARPSSSAIGQQCGLQKVFDYFDENGDGKISPSELQRCMRAAGEELSSEEAEAVVESTDADGDGLLGLEDFVKLVEGEGEMEKGRHLRDAFRMYATEEQEGGDGGRITAKSLRSMLRRLGDSRTTDECAAMIRRFDINGDGALSFDEFKIMML